MKPNSLVSKIQRIGALLCVVVFCGCASTESKGPLYQTRLHVDDSMRVFRNVEVSGFITASQRESIEAAHKDYQSAYDKAQTTSDAESVEAAKQAAEKLISLVDALD